MTNIQNIFLYDQTTKKITNLSHLPDWLSSKSVAITLIDTDIAILLKNGAYIRVSIGDFIVGNKSTIHKISSHELMSFLNTHKFSI